MKTREEVEALKREWLAEPCWDLEKTEGFEEYHDELLMFQTIKQLTRRIEELEAKLENHLNRED